MKYSDIINAFRDGLRAFSKLKFNFSENSFEYAVAQVCANLMSKTFASIENTEQRTSLLKATGEDLDNIVGNFGITRKLQSPSQGHLRIFARSLPTTPTIIPARTSFSDDSGNSYVTTEICVVPTSISYYPDSVQGIMSGRYYALPLDEDITEYIETDLSAAEIQQQLIATLDVSASSVNVGYTANVLDSVITTSNLASVSVTNPKPFTGGTDVEGDEGLRSRAYDLIRGANSKFSKSYLEYAIKSMDGVLDANIVEDFGCLTFTPPEMGTIYAIVNTSTIPIDTDPVYGVVRNPRNIYEQVRNAVESYRPCGIGIGVLEADVINVQFRTESDNGLVVYVKNSAIPTTKKVMLSDKLVRYFNSLKIGDSVYKSDVIKVLKEDNDVIDVDSFTFFKVTSYNSTGTAVGSEATYINCAGNQVCRIKSIGDIPITVLYL